MSVHLSICPSVRLYICPSVSSSVSLSLYLILRIDFLISFARSVIVCSTCSHRTKVKNPLNASIICPSVCPLIIKWKLCSFVFVLVSSVGVQHHNAFIPTLGSEGPQWGPVKLIYQSVLVSISLFLCLSVFLSLCPVVRIDFW